MTDDVTRLGVEEMRRQAEQLAAEEAAQAPAKPDAGKPLAIKHDFVLQCCWADEKGMGLLYAALMRHKFVYVPEHERARKWMRWHGHYWEQVYDVIALASVERVVERLEEARALEQSLKKEAEELSDDGGAKQHGGRIKILAARIRALHQQKGVATCLNFATINDDPLLVSAEDLDQTPSRMACANGVVDMRTGEHSPGRPEDYITRSCVPDWTGLDTPSPKWEGMLLDIFGDPTVAHYFHKLIGYALCGRPREKLFAILLGEEGDSGKTTIFETLYKIVRDYAAPMPVELLLEQGGAAQNPHAPTPAIMALRGIRLSWASEPGEGRRFSVERIKLMSGNDSLVGRDPYAGQATFPPTHTLFLLTNHKLRAAAHDQAFWSRVRLMECPYSFVDKPTRPHERQRKYGLDKEICETEGPGVMAWIVRGFQLYQAEGLEPPEAVIAATGRYRREEDIIEDWMDECIDPDEGGFETAADMYGVFAGWYIANHDRNVWSSIAFGKRAGKKIRKEKESGQIRYLGVRLKDQARQRFLK